MENRRGNGKAGRYVVDTLRVQEADNHILAPNLYFENNYPKPRYLIIGFLDPLGYTRP